MGVDQAVGRRGGRWGGGGDVGVEELHGGVVGCPEVGVVIPKKSRSDFRDCLYR